MGAVKDVYDWLGAEGLVGSTWVVIERTRTDNIQNRVIVVVEDGGPEPEVGADSGIGSAAMAFPGVLLRFRGEPGQAIEVQEKAQDIQNRLHGLRGVDIGDNHYLEVRVLTSEPIFVGFDEKKRPEFTVALRLTRAQAAPIS